MRQLGAFHGTGTGTISWYPKGSPEGVKGFLTHTGTDFQTLLPRKSTSLGPGEAAVTPSAAAFGFKLGTGWSEPALNAKNPTCVASFGEASCGHLVRFWPMEDRAGVPMPGRYLATMDFADADSGNYDYQDNFYLVTNVAPEDATVDATAPTLTARQPAPGASAVAVGANAVAEFSEPMHPASLGPASFTLAPSAGGAPVAATITASLGGARFTLDPSAALAPGTAYAATVTAAAADAASNPLAQGASWTFTTAAALGPGPGPGPTDPDPVDPGVRTPETVNPTPETAENAFCTRWCLRYPELEGSLARRLAAAKKAKLAAATPKARGAAARQIALVARTQKQATARFAATCRVPA